MISKVFQYWSSSEEEIADGRAMNPALLTRISSFPNEDVIAPTAFEIEEGSKTSRWTVISCGGLWFADLAAAWRLLWICGGKGSIELSAIWDAPAFANERAVARPMPPDAPVMKIAWPLWLNLVGSMAG